MSGEPVSERIEVAGVRPATFRLVERKEALDLYRGARKIGAARREGRRWRGEFDGVGGRWAASAESASTLLKLIGAWLLTQDARAEAARPLEEVHPEARVKGRPTADQRISIEFLKRGRERRIAELDAALKDLGKRVSRVGRG